MKWERQKSVGKISLKNVEGLSQRFGPGIATGLAGAFHRAGKPRDAIRIYREFAELLADQDAQGNHAAILRLKKMAGQYEAKVQ
ncbi:hypothetical protein CKO51_23410 [Rhodopirellula sp. SM50]|nr:hypothetical protein [Rhodopirellula sp. SM50]PAY17113.1 hypothetical protein CKO51_23410 [Rhodopirellula sp. SM50]